MKTDSVEVPSWFKLAYVVAIEAMDRLRQLPCDRSLDLAHVLLLARTPQDAVDTIKDVTRAMGGKADLLAQAVGIPDHAFAGAYADEEVEIIAVADAFNTWQALGGKRVVRNSPRAFAVLDAAVHVLDDLANRNAVEYQSDTGEFALGEDVRCAFAVCAGIDGAGLARRGAEQIISPDSARFCPPARSLAECVRRAEERIRFAERILELASRLHFATWQAQGIDLYQKLHASLDHERTQIEGNLNTAKVYTRFVQEGLVQRQKGNHEAAAVSFLQAGSVGRAVNDIEGTEILSNYEKGLSILATLPESPLTDEWRQSVLDHSVDLLRRYPSLACRVQVLKSRVETPHLSVSGR